MLEYYFNQGENLHIVEITRMLKYVSHNGTGGFYYGRNKNRDCNLGVVSFLLPVVLPVGSRSLMKN